MFKDVTSFDAQNAVIGSLLREIDLGKRSTNSDLIKKSLSKAPDINNMILLQKVKQLKKTPINYNDNDDDDDNNDNNINNSKNINYNNISVSPPPSPVKFGDIFEAASPSFNFNNVDLQEQQQQQPFDRFSTAAIPGTQVMSEIEKVVEKEKTKEQEKEITPSDPLLEYFKNTDQILNYNFILGKEKNESELENFKKQYQIETLTDEIDQGRITEILEFYFGGPDYSFFAKILDLNPDEDTMLFMQLLATDYGSQIMKQNRLSIHSSTGDLCYDGVNTNKSLFDFIVSQKNRTKKRIREKLHYGGTFEQYLSEFLPDFDADSDARLDTLTNKSIKYLFYRYNDYLAYKGLEPSPIIHTKLSTHEVVMEKLQNRDWQYLIESLIYNFEKGKDSYKIKTTEESEMIQDMSKNYRLLRRIHHDLCTTIAENFKFYLSTLTQIDSDINCGLNSFQNVKTATE